MGGDEFCVILIDSPAAAAWMVAHKLQAKILESMSSDLGTVEVSIGAATFISIPDTVMEMIAVSDQLM